MSTDPKQADPIDALAGKHWLKFSCPSEPGHHKHVIGCQCGFTSDLDSAMGWGDDVVNHMMRVAFEEGMSRADAKVVRVEALAEKLEAHGETEWAAARIRATLAEPERDEEGSR